MRCEMRICEHILPSSGQYWTMFSYFANFFHPSSYPLPSTLFTLLFIYIENAIEQQQKLDISISFTLFIQSIQQQGRFIHNIPWCCRFEYDRIWLRVDRNGTSFECKQYAWWCDWFTIGTCKKREESYTGQLFDKWQCAPFVPNLIWFIICTRSFFASFGFLSNMILFRGMSYKTM